VPEGPSFSATVWDFSGQVALVTGGTRGIGAAITRALLEAGARVKAIHRVDTEAAAAFVEACPEPLRERLSVTKLDVADQDAVLAFFSGWNGPLHILVNNAGVREDALLGMMSARSWNQVLAVNLTGAFHMAKHAVRRMIGDRYGRIITITSPAAAHGIAGQSNYAAAKAGVVAMMRSLCREVAARGITVNCVCPGFVKTDLLAGLSEERLAEMQAEVPMGRFASADAIAGAVLFLASPEAGYITGATIPVTGGL
jgi:3-oxoacyl-[acyl-carrier protein] reductase